VEGYDLCYMHNHPDGDLARVASVFDAGSGRALDVLTTEPAVVLYTADYLDGSLVGKKGVAYPKHAGVCLETGRPPDAVHHPAFPSTVLRPSETYRHTCVYRFSARD
ncbi:MAG: galactose-1-epimerase, partial [Opitutae bacterium]|nr:galactose-1-epimerase [Opitutae bacterium]